MNISIRYKLLLSFFSLAALVSGLNLYSLHVSNSTIHQFAAETFDAFPRLEALLQMQNATLRITNFIKNLNAEVKNITVNQITPNKVGAAKDQLFSYFEEIDHEQKAYQIHLKGKEDKSLNTTELNTIRNNVILHALSTFNAIEKNQKDQTKLEIIELNSAQSHLDYFIKNALYTEHGMLEQAQSNFINDSKKIASFMYLANIITFLVAIGLSLFLTHIISRPIIYLRDFAGNINYENLGKRAKINSNDEIGELAKALNTMSENLAQANSKLIETSRRAGISEVATGVLHNMGNVLNSINISASTLLETIKTTHVESLRKTLNLIQKNQGNLDEYLKNDKQGKLIISYLNTLTDYFVKEKENIKLELQNFRKNLEVINKIVSIQQTYSKVTGVKETIQLSELIEETLRLYNAIIKKFKIEIDLHLGAVHSIVSIKSKIQQILGNLIKNAIDFYEFSDSSNKVIKIILEEMDEYVCISVTDYAVGIDQETLSKIFTFGFTTKQHGHGYGLHNSVLFAKELGGKLTVESKGIGKGATFTLKLPFQMRGNSAKG